MSQWTEAEDDILRKGVQKYGTSAWGAVCALIPTRNAAEVKRRYESTIRLDSEWTDEKDKLLMHYSKALRNNWATIGEMIGMPPQQCAERAELLENRTVGLDDSTPLISATSAAPEHQKAVPNPQDLDDETREAIATAEARMSQDNGRKAQRKLRERTEAAEKEIQALDAATQRGDELPAHKPSDATDIFSAQTNQSAALSVKPKITKQHLKSPAGTQNGQPEIVDLTDDPSDAKPTASSALMTPRSVVEKKTEGRVPQQPEPEARHKTEPSQEQTGQESQVRATPEPPREPAEVQEMHSENREQSDEEDNGGYSEKVEQAPINLPPASPDSPTAREEVPSTVDRAEDVLAAESAHLDAEQTPMPAFALGAHAASQTFSEFDSSDSEEEQEVLQMDQVDSFEQSESIQTDEDPSRDDEIYAQNNAEESPRPAETEVVDNENSGIEQEDTPRRSESSPKVHRSETADVPQQTAQGSAPAPTSLDSGDKTKEPYTDPKPVREEPRATPNKINVPPQRIETNEPSQDRTQAHEEINLNQGLPVSRPDAVDDEGEGQTSTTNISPQASPASSQKKPLENKLPNNPVQSHPTQRTADLPDVKFDLRVSESPFIKNASELERKLKLIAAGEVLPVPQCSETLHEQVKKWIPHVNFSFKCTEPQTTRQSDGDLDISEVQESFKTTSGRPPSNIKHNENNRKEDLSRVLRPSSAKSSTGFSESSAKSPSPSIRDRLSRGEVRSSVSPVSRAQSPTESPRPLSEAPIVQRQSGSIADRFNSEARDKSERASPRPHSGAASMQQQPTESISDRLTGQAQDKSKRASPRPHSGAASMQQPPSESISDRLTGQTRDQNQRGSPRPHSGAASMQQQPSESISDRFIRQAHDKSERVSPSPAPRGNDLRSRLQTSEATDRRSIKADMTMDESAFMTADDTFSRAEKAPSKRSLPESISDQQNVEAPATKKPNLDPTSNEWMNQFGGLFDV